MEKKKSLLQLTWPIFIESFFFMLLGSVDVYMLSRYSDNAAGSIGVSNQVIGISGLVFTIITTGTAIVCAQYIGANKEKKEMHKLIGAALQINALAGIIMSVIMFFFAKQLLGFMALETELFEDGMAYMQIVGGFVFLQSIVGTLTAVLRSYGKTMVCMVNTLFMNIFNVCMNYMLIFGKGPFEEMGVRGAAISTTISKIIALFVLGTIAFSTVIKDFNIKYLFAFNKEELRKILHLGLPSAGETISYNMARLFVTRVITAIGSAAVITNTYLSTITNYNYLFAVAIAQGTAIMIGWKIGANEKEEAYKLCLSSFWKGFTMSMIITGGCIVFGRYILECFTEDKYIIELGITIFIIDIINEAGRSANLIIINSLRAAGDVRFPVVVGVISNWGIGVLLSFVFGIVLDMGFPGVWLALGLDEAVRGVIMYIRWKKKKWWNMSNDIAKNDADIDDLKEA